MSKKKSSKHERKIICEKCRSEVKEQDIKSHIILYNHHSFYGSTALFQPTDKGK